MKIIPVILSGGSGTRLWPLSRRQYPKQFLQLLGSNSLFQETEALLSILFAYLQNNDNSTNMISKISKYRGMNLFEKTFPYFTLFYILCLFV